MRNFAPIHSFTPMLGFNHVAGGYTITAIGASLFDINVFSKPEYLAIIWIGAILPDIDHTKSLIGKAFYPLARYIDRNFGHRTITHSAACWLSVTLICYLFEKLVFKTELHTWLFSLAYFSHLLLDMCTLQGIPLFYPFTSDMCVLPANPALRVRTDDLKSEVLIFLGFCILLISMLDLITAGLTPSFNSNFRTFEYLHRQTESNKSKQLKIQYTNNIGQKKNATVVESFIDKILVYDSTNGFAELKKKDFQILDIQPTGKKNQITTYKFVSIADDSLRKILSVGKILELEFVSTVPITYFKNDLQQVGKTIKIERVPAFTYHVSQLVGKDTSTAQIKLQIQKLQNHIAQAQAKYNTQAQDRQNTQNEIQKIESNLPTMDNYTKTKAIAQIKDLRKELEKPAPELPNTANQQAEIQYLAQKLTSNQNTQTPPTFTGKAKIWKK